MRLIKLSKVEKGWNFFQVGFNAEIGRNVRYIISLEKSTEPVQRLIHQAKFCW